jgi:pimeloyl-ACP methyl ester carboxylesterase
VPENRDKPDGRKVSLFVAVLPANTLHPRADPLFILAGGPGQAASFLGPFAAALTGVRKDRDIVLVDQRGTGRSSPLVCAAFKPDRSLKAALEFDPLPKVTACAQELAAKGVDAAQYTTAAWVADLDAVRAALGYDKINLWGGSYGTRAAQEYLRRHADHVRSVVLDGVPHRRCDPRWMSGPRARSRWEPSSTPARNRRVRNRASGSQGDARQDS